MGRFRKRALLASLSIVVVVGLASWAYRERLDREQQETRLQQAVAKDKPRQELEAKLRRAEGRLIDKVSLTPKTELRGFYIFVTPAWDALTFQERANKTLNWYEAAGRWQVAIMVGSAKGLRAAVYRDGTMWVLAPGNETSFKRHIDDRDGPWIRQT